ncbi:MAG: SH3 domain-containing protein [Spirosomataceae bacterium]
MPKNITVIVNLGRDKTLKNSGAYQESLAFSYTSANGKTQTQYLPIEIYTEGYEKVIKRKSLLATSIYCVLYLGANKYLPSRAWTPILWWIAAFFLWKTSNWFFSKKPLNKPMVMLLPSIFIACLYFGIRAAFKPKDADLIIIPINEMAYIKTTNGALIRDFPIEGTSLGLIVYGDSVKVLGRDSTSNWYKVSYYNGGTTFGYMSKELLTFDKSEVRTRKKKTTNSSRANRAMNKSRKPQTDSTKSTDESFAKPDSI